MDMDSSFQVTVWNNKPNFGMVIHEFKYKGELYAELKGFSQKRGISISTLRRRIAVVEKTHKESECERFLLKINGKIYVSEAIAGVIGGAKVCVPQTLITSQKECLTSKSVAVSGPLPYTDEQKDFVSKYDWDFFGTVNYAENLSMDRVKFKASEFFKNLSERVGGAGVRYFLAAENAFGSHKGFHFHFLCRVEVANKKNVKRVMQGFFRAQNSANAKIDDFDPTKGGIAYILKEVEFHKRDNCEYNF